MSEFLAGSSFHLASTEGAGGCGEGGFEDEGHSELTRPYGSLPVTD